MSATPETQAAAAPARTTANHPKRCEQPTVLNNCLQRRFSPEILKSLQQRLPDYLTARGVELRRNGTRLVGRCPNHDDANPSFAVFGTHHATCGCYPCGFSGDVFAVSKWLGRSSTFPEAVQDVAASLGVSLPHLTAGTTPRPATAPPRPAMRPPAIKPLPPLPVGFEEAATVARASLYQACKRRTMTALAVARELGTDLETLASVTFTCDAVGLKDGKILYLYESGVKVRHPKGHHPRFQWTQGNPRLPWRWHFAARPEVSTVFITEGESDAIAAIGAGLENLHPHDGTEAAAVIACPGTSFSHAWGPLFKEKRVILLFDADAPGQAAAVAAARIIKPHAKSVAIANWKGTPAQ